jgi:hypothetical protein
MGLIKEPLDVDFEFNPRPLSSEERQRISDYIKTYKAKNLKRQSASRQKKNALAIK